MRGIRGESKRNMRMKYWESEKNMRKKYKESEEKCRESDGNKGKRKEYEEILRERRGKSEGSLTCRESERKMGRK